MKKRKKKVLGFFGLLLVAVMTFVAVIVPGPETSALANVTNTIEVRVAGSVPSAKFKEPNQNITTTDSEHLLLITHEKINSARIKLRHKHEDGSVDEYEYAFYNDLNYQVGEKGTNVDFKNYGYGEFVFSLYGTGQDGGEIEFDEILIKYVPIIVGPVFQDDNGKVITNIEAHSDDVEVVEIYVDGVLVKTVTKDELDSEIELPMSGYESGSYEITFLAKDTNDERLYLPTQKALEYEKNAENVYTPDTGNFFQKLNASNEDYAITGILIFFVFGIVAIGIVAKGDKKSKSQKKKH